MKSGFFFHPSNLQHIAVISYCSTAKQSWKPSPHLFPSYSFRFFPSSTQVAADSAISNDGVSVSERKGSVRTRLGRVNSESGDTSYPASVQAKSHHFLRNGCSASALKASHFKLPSVEVGARQYIKSCRQRPCILVANSDRLETEITDTTSNETEQSNSPSKLNLPASDALQNDAGLQPTTDAESNLEGSGVSNGLAASTTLNGESLPTNRKSTVKRSPLTAREKLRAARVLNRYTEPKASKPKLGSKLLDALKESDKGKRRPSLPEAPTNMFDDSKRGMPKPGWTFDFPGGVDVLLVIFSFLFISTVMFATTYVVWKVGAIHFNEY